MECTTLQVTTGSPAQAAKPPETESHVRYARPATDVFESPGGWMLSIDLPGVPKDQVSLSVDGDVLEVAAARDEVSGFARRFRLPRGVDRTAISAHHERGVLSVSVPRQPDTAPITITVE